jgi:hypothetical protein
MLLDFFIWADMQGDNNAAGKLGVPFGAVLGAAAVFIL